MDSETYQIYYILQPNGGFKPEAIHHRVCGMTSYHPMDIEKRWCENCEKYLDETWRNDDAWYQGTLPHTLFRLHRAWGELRLQIGQAIAGRKL